LGRISRRRSSKFSRSEIQISSAARAASKRSRRSCSPFPGNWPFLAKTLRSLSRATSRDSPNDRASSKYALWPSSSPSNAPKQTIVFIRYSSVSWRGNGRSVGKRITSFNECVAVRTAVSRSIPIPSPQAGGMPCSIASRNSSSMR